MRHDLQARYPDYANKVKFYIGDVRDPRSVADAMPGVDYNWHAASLKQVPSCEFFPMQAVKTSYQWRIYRFEYNSEQFRIISRGICNIILNIVLFLPFGYLVPILFPEKIDRYWKMLCIGLAFTFLIELLQFISYRECFDLDDLMHNMIGSMIGYYLYKHVISADWKKHTHNALTTPKDELQ